MQVVQIHQVNLLLLLSSLKEDTKRRAFLFSSFALHREIMSKYDDLDGTPILRNEVEEQELLRHLNKITRRSERTMAEDEIIRRGYYKILHRVINSMATMDRRDDMDRARLKRCVYYISSRLCEYWNSGIPIIFSHDQETEIRLVSSQGMTLCFNSLVFLLLVAYCLLHLFISLFSSQRFSTTCGQ